MKRKVPVHVVPLDNMLRGEFDENAVREDFTPSEWVEISKALKGREEKAAKERQREHGGTAPGKSKNTSANLAEVKGESRERVAKAAGIGHTTLKKAAEVCEAAEAEPEKYQPLVAEMRPHSHRAQPKHREEKKRSVAPAVVRR